MLASQQTAGTFRAGISDRIKGAHFGRRFKGRNKGAA